MNSFGFYPCETTEKNHFRLFRGACVSLLFITYIAQIMSMPFYMDFSDIIEPFMIAVTEFAFLCKLLVFIKNGKKILELIDDMSNTLLFKKSFKCSKSFQKEIKYTRWFTNIYRTVLVCYVSYLTLLKPLVETKGDKDKRSLPLGGYIPCDIERNDCYVGFTLYQSLTGCVSSLTNINMECLFCKLISTCCCEFDILSYNLRNIDYRFEETAEKELTSNVIFHQKLLR